MSCIIHFLRESCIILQRRSTKPPQCLSCGNQHRDLSASYDTCYCDARLIAGNVSVNHHVTIQQHQHICFWIDTLCFTLTHTNHKVTLLLWIFILYWLQMFVHVCHTTVKNEICVVAFQSSAVGMTDMFLSGFNQRPTIIHCRLAGLDHLYEYLMKDLI